jgi:ABC-type multidrug transport system ATPase subunit
VALARAYLADPDLLVLDEATSAVDPATEVRLQSALEGVTRGRTSVAIAHRLSTAEAADLVVVVDRGRVIDVGHHDELLARCGVYQRLFASWRSQTAQPASGRDGGPHRRDRPRLRWCENPAVTAPRTAPSGQTGSPLPADLAARLKRTATTWSAPSSSSTTPGTC